MGKDKRRKSKHGAHTSRAMQARAINANNKKLGLTPSTPSTSKKSTKKSSSSTSQKQHLEPTLPFDPLDRILTIGDGDLSFSRSLISHHGCANLLATTFDTLSEVVEKYPQAEENIKFIEGEGQRVLHGVDATRLSQREVKKVAGGWQRVIFNFPHVGGKSTDVNRQVRYNQEMLVNFFKSITPLLSPTGTITVTLFESEPYTLWNIRDLARHSGLEVQISFRFQPDAYPGYAHARTLGNIEGNGGAWKGEERTSRSYVFQLKGAGEKPKLDWREAREEQKREKKRKEMGDDSSDEE